MASTGRFLAPAPFFCPNSAIFGPDLAIFCPNSAIFGPDSATVGPYLAIFGPKSAIFGPRLGDLDHKMDSNHSPFINSISTRLAANSHHDTETVILNPSALVLSLFGLVVSMLASCSLNPVEIEVGGCRFESRRF